MNSKVIKFVAGGGKTTRSLNILKSKQNGLYLAYTNSVVNEISSKGFLSKTIDSLFFGYIIPKFTYIMPLIQNKKLVYKNDKLLNDWQKGILNIHINYDGTFMYKGRNQKNFSKTSFNLKMKWTDFLNNKDKQYYNVVKQLFNDDSIFLTNTLINELSDYLLENYSKQIISILQERFSYIIFDEAQDLSAYREKFASIVYNSNIPSIYLGDSNQNIMGGGKWFENLEANESNLICYRCSDAICEVIREKTKIEIIGNNKHAKYYKITYDEVKKIDDGNRTLLYSKKTGYEDLINNWKGIKMTIKSAKGSTIKNDIVLIGKTLNKKSFYVALTRTTKNAFSCIEKIT